MITMAESRQTFKMYHYQQIRQEPKQHIDGHFRMSKVDFKRDDSRSKGNPKDNPVKYPWLTEDDRRRHQTNAKILYVIPPGLRKIPR